MNCLNCSLSKEECPRCVAMEMMQVDEYAKNMEELRKLEAELQDVWELKHEYKK